MNFAESRGSLLGYWLGLQATVEVGQGSQADDLVVIPLSTVGGFL